MRNEFKMAASDQRMLSSRSFFVVVVIEKAFFEPNSKLLTKLNSFFSSFITEHQKVFLVKTKAVLVIRHHPLHALRTGDQYFGILVADKSVDNTSDAALKEDYNSKRNK